MEILFIQLSDDQFVKIAPYDCLLQGHTIICIIIKYIYVFFYGTRYLFIHI